MEKKQKEESKGKPGWSLMDAQKLREMAAVLTKRAAWIVSEEGLREVRRVLEESVQTAVAVIRSAMQAVAERVSGKSEPAPPSGASKKPLDERSKQELYGIAKKLEIEGRSKMSKQQLADAIRQQG